MKVYENQFMALIYVEDPGILELNWKSATETMTPEDFKASLYVYGGFAIEKKVPCLMVDIHEFQFGGAMSEELTIWRDKQIFPKYNEAGVKRFAFWGDSAQLPPQDPPQSPYANFTTRFFFDKDTLNSSFKE